ncbi:hypothetical protein EST38_g8936 [Candolleomyces aberdarensis]|uniref:Uncharacterized protein n=1 Tax=Candolleomyces aberdarensis TaxID=2316362 RepID=A0A4Q2DB85_9AGAR|nr:hypothetical protein EST38_g8936 [Candolleomyces aberdarensis]
MDMNKLATWVSTYMPGVAAQQTESANVSQNEEDDDIDSEKAHNSSEEWSYIRRDANAASELPSAYRLDFSISETELIEATIANSKEIAETTDKSYKRLMGQYESWVIKRGFVKASKDVDVFGKDVRRLTPFFIIGWIMAVCDDTNPDQTKKPATQTRASYSHAMKMRAALTYGFGRYYGRGSNEWHMLEDGRFIGNPSISSEVARYMVALRKRKKAQGDATTLAQSSRAMNAQTFGKLYDYNRKYWESANDEAAKGTWGGKHHRLLVHAVATLSFFLLLRLDETLSIKTENVKIVSDSEMIIYLEKRKNQPAGGRCLHSTDLSVVC